MREEVLREIVTRMLTDTVFAQDVRERPGVVLRRYKLTGEESAALHEQLDSTRINPLRNCPDQSGHVPHDSGTNHIVS